MKISFFRILKTTLWVTGIIAGSCMVTALIIGLFYGEEIKQLIIQSINKNLATKIQVQKIDFSLFRHFPNATVDLENVVAKDAVESEQKDTLLRAGHLSLLFNVKEIFSKDVSVKKIILRDAAVNIRIDENGKNNYHFWKSSGGKSDSSSGSVVDLEKVILKNVYITYSDIRARQRYAFTAKDGTLKGKFTDDEFELKTDANLFVDHLWAGNTDYVQQKEVKIKSSLQVNNKTDTYRFGETQVRIAGLLFDVKGNVVSGKEVTGMNLQIDSHEAELQSLLKLLPPSYTTYFKKYKSKGKFVFQSTIKGEEGHGRSPDVKFVFTLANGSLNPESSPVAFDHINLNGTFVQAASKPGELFIKSFNGKLAGKEISGDLKITDFKNPFLSFHAKADLDLNSIRPFISHDTLESLNGNMKLNIAFAGKVKELKQYTSAANYQSNSSGNISLENVSFRLKKNPLEFKNISGQFSLKDNNVEVQSLDGNISSTDIHLKGMFRNFITFLLLPGQDAVIDASISSGLIELNELLANKAETAKNDTSYKIKINPRLICRLNLSAKKLVFRKFEATNISGMVRIEDQIISSPDLRFNSMSGDVMMSASINTAKRNNVMIGCKAKISKMDITQLFYEMENFDQQTMTDKNVKGRISAGVDFNSSWSNDLVINPASVVSNADIMIENGELNDFKPILPLAKYLKIADLKHIKFSTLSNTINIHDRKIFFPSMEINSSALNLTASGVHDFDNNVDYKLRMLLSDVLGKKVKEQNTEFGTIEDDGLGRSKLFLSMKGPIDNPKFSYDQKAVAEKIKSDFKTDKQNIKQLLKQDLGLFKRDPTVSLQKKKKDELQVDWDSKPE